MSLLLSSGAINNLELKNKIVMPPMCMYKSEDDGTLNDFHFAHYTARALGGVGFIIVEATAIESKGRISNNDLGIWNSVQAKLHEKLNEKLHYFGTKTAIQLAHAGRKSLVENEICVAPSPISFSNEESYKMPKELSIEEINNIKKLYIEASIRAKEANYDAIELHAAHGYLLCEFLSSNSNKRKDLYGGTLENRCRLVLEIAQEIKNKVKLPLIVRINADEWMNEGWNISDAIYLSKELQKISVDAIHVTSGGNLENPNKSPKIEPLYQSNWAKEIKKNINIPVIAVGIITTSSEGEYLLKNNYCDFVAYGRELLRNPNFVFKAANELKEKEKINVSYERAYR